MPTDPIVVTTLYQEGCFVLFCFLRLSGTMKARGCLLPVPVRQRNGPLVFLSDESARKYWLQILSRVSTIYFPADDKYHLKISVVEINDECLACLWRCAGNPIVMMIDFHGCSSIVFLWDGFAISPTTRQSDFAAQNCHGLERLSAQLLLAVGWCVVAAPW